MTYRQLGTADVELSVIGLGGHEFLPDGRPRGFGEDGRLATTPGHIFPGFGGQARKEILSSAYDLGVNFLDVTQDSEKEALGRNLRELPPPHPVYVQTRPEGMVYAYDENNRKMADYGLLEAEVERILRLIQRDYLDFLNFAFMRSALDADPGFLDTIGENVARLKRTGLILFTTADTFSGESTYLRQIASGHFDVIFVNLNVGDDAAVERVLPAAHRAGMGVIAREAFMKGRLFAIAEEAGIEDRDAVAAAAVRWTLSRPGVTSLLIGAANPEQLRTSVAAAAQAGDAGDESVIEAIRSTEQYRRFAEQKRDAFLSDE